MLDEHDDKFPRQVAAIAILAAVVGVIILALLLDMAKMPPLSF